MKFRGVLSREAANLLMVLTSQLKDKGVTIDLKVIDTMECLLRIARIFNHSKLNDLANRLEIEYQLTPAIDHNEPVIPAPVKPRKTRTIIYRGQKVEVEV